MKFSSKNASKVPEGKSATKGKIKRHFSIPFFLAIPGNFILTGLGIIGLHAVLAHFPLETERWAVFGTGLLSSMILVGAFKVSTLRVLMHELKHGIVVKLTGNKLYNMKVGSQTGHVEYAMYEDRVHFAPIIALAPYFYPLLSLPTFIACVLLEDLYSIPLCLALGMALGTDVASAIAELHPNQTDFQKISGGFFASALYLAGVHMMWCTICLIWLAAGRNGFAYAGYVVLEVMGKIALDTV